jgi:hypothetical protein
MPGPTLTSGNLRIELIDSSQVPEDQRQNKAFPPGSQAAVMWNVADPGTKLYFTEAELDAFVGGLKDGDFDHLLGDQVDGA